MPGHLLSPSHPFPLHPDPPMSRRTALVSFFLALVLGAAMAWAGSRGGAVVPLESLDGSPLGFLAESAVPLFALCVVVAFVIQWVAFVPAYAFQTELFYDLTGSLTYVTVTILALALAPAPGLRSLILGAMVLVWATRLGTFLFRRALEAAGDSRFDDIKPSFVRFLNTWTLQGLWVTITSAAALAAITGRGGAERAGGGQADGRVEAATDIGGSATGDPSELGVAAVVGVLVWVVGFRFEVVADRQKRRFRADPGNEGEFIRSGLWSLSRHPNYFGEIVLWTGVALVALPALEGWQHATLISPLFVYLLLTRVSGIPMLEAKADERWGGQAAYEAYKRETPLLWPRPNSKGE